MSSTSDEQLRKDVQFFEYTKAANPVSSGTISVVPFCEFLSHLHEEGPTRIIPFDLSKELVCDGPASSPNLSANFIRIESGKEIRTSVNATSELFFVIRVTAAQLVQAPQSSGMPVTSSCCPQARIQYMKLRAMPLSIG